MMMQVQVPVGLQPGGQFQAMTPSGPVLATVPYGVNGGQFMTIQVPVMQAGMVPQPQMMVQQPQMMMMQQPQMMMQQPQMMAPQPMVMNQAAMSQQPAAPQQQPAAGPKRGTPGLLIWQVNVHPLGESCEGCCGRGASPVGQLVEKKGGAAPDALKDVISDAAFELIVEKLDKWQQQLPCQCVPCCEVLCFCPPCLPCYCCMRAQRSSWEESTTNDINEMLKRYNTEFKFEHEDCMKPHAKLVWS